MLQVSNVNMIITDYCMPGMTGYELLKRVKVMLILKFRIKSKFNEFLPYN